MRLQRYGVTLETLKAEHLEMVRLWRNQEFVRTNMQFQQALSREDQEHWFANLDTSKNIYWIIHTHQYPIGLIQIKDVDAATATGEAGIFIGEPSYLEMPQPMLAILFMMELAFFGLHLKKLKAKIKSGNKRAISFNKKLGYQLLPHQAEGFQYYQVDAARFEQCTARLRASAANMYGAKTGIDLSATSTGLARTLSEQILGNKHFAPFAL